MNDSVSCLLPFPAPCYALQWTAWVADPPLNWLVQIPKATSPTGNRIIISIPVIVQPGFSVKILPRETEIVDDGVDLNLSLTIGQISCLPDHGAGGGDELLGRTQMIVEEVVQAGVILVLPHGQRLAFQIEIIPERRAIGQGLSNQPVSQIIDVMRGHTGNSLADPPVLAVVDVAGRCCYSPPPE